MHIHFKKCNKEADEERGEYKQQYTELPKQDQEEEKKQREEYVNYMQNRLNYS